MNRAQYGIDIGRERVDDWDKLLLREVRDRQAAGLPTTVLEVGCGAGGQAVRLAVAGALVVALDIDDYQQDVETVASDAGVGERVSWRHESIVDFVHTQESQPFTYVSMQRVLHYLPYETAHVVLRTLATITTEALYLSVTGTTSAIATHHRAVDLPVTERFVPLTPVGQSLFAIEAPICPYSTDELLMAVASAGWVIEKVRLSDFGNIKVVARPTLL
jgi:SAM-dependent methyltransferase